MKFIKIGNLKKHGLRFIFVFIAVSFALAINNWNENRKQNQSENKILAQISNGLEKDIDEIRLYLSGYKARISACNIFRDALSNNKVNSDSLLFHYFNLTKFLTSVQNAAGYEALKSEGLELIKNDSLRIQIISLYENDYKTLRKLEEESSKNRFNEDFFKNFNQSLARNFQFDIDEKVIGIDLPLQLSSEKKNILLLYLWKIQDNRTFVLQYYSEIENKINKILESINLEIKH